MTKTHAQSTIAEIEAAIAAGKATLAQAHDILAPRAARKDSKSGERAARWIEKNPLTQAPAKAKRESRHNYPRGLRNPAGDLLTGLAWTAKMAGEGGYHENLDRLVARFHPQHAAA